MRSISSSFAGIFPVFLFVSLENLNEEENKEKKSIVQCISIKSKYQSE